MRKKYSSVLKRKKFDNEEAMEDQIDQAIDEVEQEEGEGIESAEDIAVLVMALDDEKVEQSEEAKELLEKITGLPEEGVDMILEIKSNIEDSEEEVTEESMSKKFSKIARGILMAKKRFSRRFSKRREFDEDDVEIIVDVLDDDIVGNEIPEDAVAGSVAEIMDDSMEKEDVIEVFSRKMAYSRVKSKKFNKTQNAKFSFENAISRTRGTALSAKMKMSRNFSARPTGNLIPSRTENMRIRKIGNSFDRVATVRPQNPRDLNAGYDGKVFSKIQSPKGVSDKIKALDSLFE